jgi:DNA repair exonuclease SbcCD ATPase subunit
MTEDIRTWLAEIENLKQQVAKLQQERDEALQSADRWCQLYNKEAQRYRTQVQHSQKDTSDSDRGDAGELSSTTGEASGSPVPADIDHLPASELKNRLQQAYQKIHRLQEQTKQLQEALATEKQNHAQTRKNLTTALGDAVERLGKVQGRRHDQQQSDSSTPSQGQNPQTLLGDSANGSAMVPTHADTTNEEKDGKNHNIKNPSVELPPLQ